MVNRIDGMMLKEMFASGAALLTQNRESVDALNVFPVPDGDTGTNMTQTITSAIKEMNSKRYTSAADVADAVARGALKGARGNSGVILSQILRGFARALVGHEEIDAPLLVKMVREGANTAYKAVMKPKEGTILTVARVIADEVEKAGAQETDIVELFKVILSGGDAILRKTPEMLPVLKQAGVVDSGGQGLMQVLKGAYDAFLGKEIDYTIAETPAKEPSKDKEPVEADIKFGYCTEFIIMLNRNFNIKNEMDFKAYLESIGDSIVVVADEDVVKVHVHTNDPGLAIQRALKYGALSNMKIDNMRLEHQEKLFKESQIKEAAQQEEKMPHKEVAFVAVSVGEGINEIFKGLGVDYIIEGGQTMNPSTEDMLNAIEKVNADTIFILPNNKNIIMAANQAQAMTEDKKIIVIPTKTVPQGITAVINYVPDMSPEENAENMAREIGNVKTGQVTYAVRDTMIDDKEIKQGDYMGIGDAGILSVGSEVDDTAYDMIREMMEEDLELISLYYGADVTEEKAQALKARIEEAYPDSDIELQYGGQPIYYYIVSIE